MLRSGFLLALIDLGVLAAQKHRDDCEAAPLNIVFLQDTSHSMNDALPNILAQMKEMSTHIDHSNPGSHYTLLSFQDGAGTYCLHQECTDFGDSATLTTAYDALSIDPNASLQGDALFAIVATTVYSIASPSRPDLIILLTNAAVDRDTDGSKTVSSLLPFPSDSDLSIESPAELCMLYRSPTMKDVLRVLAEYNTGTGLLVFSPFDDWNLIFDDADDKILGSHQRVDADFSDLKSLAAEGLGNYMKMKCSTSNEAIGSLGEEGQAAAALGRPSINVAVRNSPKRFRLVIQ